MRCGHDLVSTKLLTLCLLILSIDYLVSGRCFARINQVYGSRTTKRSTPRSEIPDDRLSREFSGKLRMQSGFQPSVQIDWPVPRSNGDDLPPRDNSESDPVVSNRRNDDRVEKSPGGLLWLNRSHALRSLADGRENLRAAVAGFLFADSTDRKLNMHDAIDRNLSEILDRLGPDMRASRNYNDFADITTNISIRAWDLLHEHAALAIEQKVFAALPMITELLEEAKTSKKCVDALGETLHGAQRLEAWAVKLLNSWGGFPMSGLFDGTYSDVGSFDSCVNIDSNKYIDHAHYCTVTFRPVMPGIKDYELIVRKVPKVLRHHFETHDHPHDTSELKAGSFERFNLTRGKERDAFSDLLEGAQYHHFVYYKWGTCWPIACSPFEVKRLTRLIGRRSILLSGPVKCFSRNGSDYEQPDDFPDQATDSKSNSTERGRKLTITIRDENDGVFIWKPHLYMAHMVAFSVIAIVTAFILFMTLVDVCANRIPALYRVVSMSAKGLPVEQIINGTPDHQRHQHQASRSRTNASALAVCGETPITADFIQQQQPLTSARHQQAIRLGFSMVLSDEGVDLAKGRAAESEPTDWMLREQRVGLFMSLVDDFSIVTNAAQFFKVSANQMRTDILCLNGIRCITMIWIIMTHTMMYNDWAQFARTKSIEISLNSLINQPLYNGSYLVDTFFLMSGLLSAFTAFKHSQGISSKFNSFAYIFGRWLRLTPQILFVSMIFIILPTLSSGPHWYFLVGEYSENCMKNWWINVLHLQTFYKKDEMCNFVTWWISIDFFYHFFALAIIWVIMRLSHRAGFLSIMTLLIASVGYQSYRHYTLALPPNVLSTIPQTNAMWTTMTLDFYWAPYTHAVPFFFGFYIGYLMALKRKVIIAKLNTRRALIGWSMSVALLVGQSFSTYWWVTGRASYSKLVSTTFFGVCSIIWAGSICWIIIACQHGYGGFVNRVLSWKVFIVLGKASYLVYLSHFQILFLFYGNQHILLEPSPINMAYIVLGNITLSTLYGILLCAVYEIPWLKMHRRLMKYV